MYRCATANATVDTPLAYFHFPQKPITISTRPLAGSVYSSCCCRASCSTFNLTISPFTVGRGGGGEGLLSIAGRPRVVGDSPGNELSKPQRATTTAKPTDTRVGVFLGQARLHTGYLCTAENVQSCPKRFRTAICCYAGESLKRGGVCVCVSGGSFRHVNIFMLVNRCRCRAGVDRRKRVAIGYEYPTVGTHVCRDVFARKEEPVLKSVQGMGDALLASSSF